MLIIENFRAQKSIKHHRISPPWDTTSIFNIFSYLFVSLPPLFTAFPNHNPESYCDSTSNKMFCHISINIICSTFANLKVRLVFHSWEIFFKLLVMLHLIFQIFRPLNLLFHEVLVMFVLQLPFGNLIIFVIKFVISHIYSSNLLKLKTLSWYYISLS